MNKTSCVPWKPEYTQDQTPKFEVSILTLTPLIPYYIWGSGGERPLKITRMFSLRYDYGLVARPSKIHTLEDKTTHQHMHSYTKYTHTHKY